MGETTLDEHCKDIFSLLLVIDKPLRSNELYRRINTPRPRMTRPTLIEHLNHLHTRRIIVRKRIGRQKVTYEVNWQRLGTFEQTPEANQMLMHNLQNEKNFRSFPIDEQVTYATNILTLTNLYQLKLEVQNILEPKKGLEHTLQFLFTSRFYDLFKTWLLQSCKDSSENGQKALDMIEHNIDHFTNELFNKTPAPQSHKNERTVL